MPQKRKVEVFSAGCASTNPAEMTLLGGPMGAARAAGASLVSVLTCPECGARAEETMPEDACRFFHECGGCGKLLRPKPGDCCVFCSYGSVACPPVQAEGKRCC